MHPSSLLPKASSVTAQGTKGTHACNGEKHVTRTQGSNGRCQNTPYLRVPHLLPQQHGPTAHGHWGRGGRQVAEEGAGAGRPRGGATSSQVRRAPGSLEAPTISQRWRARPQRSICTRAPPRRGSADTQPSPRKPLSAGPDTAFPHEGHGLCTPCLPCSHISCLVVGT